MKDIRGARLVLFLLAGAGLFIVGQSAYKIYLQKREAARKQQVVAELDRVNAEDLAILAASGPNAADEKKIAQSLRRYSLRNLRGAEEYIKYYLSDRRPVVEAAALEASGAFEWAPLDRFQRALESEDRAMRLAAVRGLARRADTNRLTILDRYVRKGGLNAGEWIEGQVARHKLFSEERQKKRVENEILVQAPLMPEKYRNQAYEALFTVAPDNQELKSLALTLVRTSGNDDMAGRALQYLASYDRERLMAQVGQLEMRPSYYYQTALIDFLGAACPNGWREIGEKIERQPADPRILRQLSEARFKSKCHGGL